MKIKRLSIFVLWVALAVLLLATIGICTLSSYLMFFDNQPQPVEFLTVLFFAGTILAAVPFCCVLFQCTRFLRRLNSPKPVGADMVGILNKIIRGLVAVLGAGILFGLPVIFIAAELEDAPGLGPFGMLLILAIMTCTATAYLIRDALEHLPADRSGE